MSHGPIHLISEGHPTTMTSSHPRSPRRLLRSGLAASALLLALLPLAALAQPALVSITPVDGALVDSESVMLEGRLTGVDRLVIDGVEIALDGRSGGAASFRAGPFEQVEGERRFLLVLVGADGQEEARVHRVVADRLAPVLTLDLPGPVVVSEAAFPVRGSVSDPHLELVTVAGRPARVEGGRFEASVALEPGVQGIEVVARDRLGHESRVQLSVELDAEPPSLTLLADGSPLADGARFRRSVVPSAVAEGAVGVELRLGGRPWATGQAVSQEGEHRLEAVAWDGAGNRTVASKSFTLDTTPPRLARVRGAETVIAGRSVVLEGEVEGAVAMTVDGRPVPVEGGAFRTGSLPLEAGETVFRLVARDEAGNETVLSVPVKSDPDAPDLVVSSPAEGSAVGASPVTVSGTASDLDLASVTVKADLAAGGGTVVATLTGAAFMASVPLAEGSNTLTVTATDAVGHTDTVARTVVLDTVAPQLSVTAGGAPLLDGAVFAGLVTPEVAATDATAVTITATLDGQAWSPGTSVTTLGLHELSVTGTDAAGNSASTLLTFTVEGTAPTFASLEPASGSVLAAPEVYLTGRAEGAVTLTVDAQAVPLTGAAFTAGPYTLAEGPRTFALVATSAGGQSTSTGLTVTRDSTPPAVALTAPAASSVGSAPSVTVSGTVSDAHLVGVTVNGIPATVTGHASAGATWTAAVLLSEGENRLRAEARDTAGNVSSAERPVVLDTRAPELEILEPVPGAVLGEATATVTGRVADAHLDRVEVNGITATLSAGAGAARGFTATVSLPEGSSSVTATAFDTLGHQSSASVGVERDSSTVVIRIDLPAEGTRTSAATVDVSGTVSFPSGEAGSTVTVNGTTATASAGTFSLAGAELVEGENELVARATDSGGAQGVHVRAVTRDTTPPSLISSVPADGSAGIVRDTVFALTFSEPLAIPSAGSWRLETVAGAPIAADAELDASSLDGTILTVVPQGLLPPATEVRLVLTAQLTDLAGHALATSTLAFTTVSDGAPAAPLLQAVPSSLCADTLTVSGTADAGARVRLDGGAGRVEARAGADGSFALEVALVAGRPHLLEAVAIDGEGRISSTARAQVTHDCEPPRVLDAQLAGDVLTLAFDAPVVPASLGLTVSDASGPLAGSQAVEGASATWTADLPLPSGALRLEVAAGLEDLAGNTLGFPWVRLFGAGGASSFLSGTVVDESTGRPLGGAAVTVTASGGVATAMPRPEMTTAEDGRFLIPVAPGTHDLTIGRPGYAPVFRVVTAADGLGAEVLSPRLEPLGAEATVGVAGGRLEAQSALGEAVLEVPAGALAGNTAVRLAVLSEQAFPALLPYGWSPRGGAWIDLGEGASPTLGSSLELPVTSAAGTSLVLASLDLSTLQWRALALGTVVSTAEGPRLSVSLDPVGFGAVGAVAAVEADAGVHAPPAAVVGEVLGSSPAPSTAQVLSASLAFSPQVVLPTQTSAVTVSYTLTTPQPSGLPLTLSIQEELELLDGTLRRQAPYRAQVVLYHDSTGQPASRFRLRPSALARSQPVRLGAEDVTVLRHADDGVRGNVLGPDGGFVLGDGGDRLEVPAGALTEPTAVVLTRRSVGDLPLAPPRTGPGGGTVDAVLELDLAGRTLALPAALSFALDPPPPPGTPGL
ncbi:MAG: Ig-like domain-containing protein, partial [Holophagales bacterium]|nr:Ig-like domain-containing protein [Holophagales bacterium]